MALSNRQYDILINEYEQRRKQNEEELESRRRSLYEQLPDLAELDDEISALAVSRARRAIFSAGDPADALQAAGEQIREISAKKERLIRAAGYPSDYLNPIYTCAACRDTGFIEEAEGTRVPCHCFKKRAAELSFEAAGLPMTFRSQRFRDFSLNYYSRKTTLDEGGKSPYDSARAGLQQAKQFVRDFSEVHGNLVLYGPPGVGKTFLTSCIAGELLARDVFVLYVTAFSLFGLLKEGTFSSPGETPERYRFLFDCDLLIIDDLGTEFSNTLTNSELFTLINERILANRSTIVSTNLPLPGINEAYTERIFSRFMEHYGFIHLFGDDIRLLKKKMGKS